MREGAEAALGIGDADLAEIDGTGAALGLAHVEVNLQRLGQLKADGVAGIEARHRLLEDHRHVIADDAPALARRDGEEVDAVELHAIRGDLRGPGSRPITASIDTDLPEPDSPTMASTSLGSRASETRSTARKSPALVVKSTQRFSMARSGIQDLFVEGRGHYIAQRAPVFHAIPVAGGLKMTGPIVPIA